MLPKQEISCWADRNDIVPCRSRRAYMVHIVSPADGRVAVVALTFFRLL